MNPFTKLFRKTPVAPSTLEQKLEILSRGGLQLAPPFDVQDLSKSWKREDFEKPGFNLALVGLGMSEEQPPGRNHCVRVWHLDTECIEGDGSYCRIAERMKLMAEGSLPIEDIGDHVDLEAGKAWLSFLRQGNEIRIDCRVNDDWIDAGLFAHFVRLLSESGPSKIFLYYDLGGQDCILACVRKTQFSELKRSGVNFRPLE